LSGGKLKLLHILPFCHNVIKRFNLIVVLTNVKEKITGTCKLQIKGTILSNITLYHLPLIPKVED